MSDTLRAALIAKWSADPELQFGVPYRRMASEAAALAESAPTPEPPPRLLVEANNSTLRHALLECELALRELRQEVSLGAGDDGNEELKHGIHHEPVVRADRILGILFKSRRQGEPVAPTPAPQTCATSLHCLAESPGPVAFRCSLSKGHDGPHSASDSSGWPITVWAADAPRSTDGGPQ